jgi:F-type H+-transporting ATPase subunit alpha
MPETSARSDVASLLRELRAHTDQPLDPTQLDDVKLVQSISERVAALAGLPHAQPDVGSLLQAIREQADQLVSGGRFQDAGMALRALILVQYISEQAATLSGLPHAQPDVDSLLQAIREQADQLVGGVRFQDVGTVQRIGSGVATLSGLLHTRIDELLIFPTGVRGLVLNLDRTHIDVILLGPDEGIQGGDLVTGTDERLRVPVGPQLLGRIVNPLGEPLDEREPIEATAFYYLEREAPSIIKRAPVREPLHTGLKMIDALVPIGRGQRELILGDQQTGKTTLAVDTILNQADSGVKCVYVAIGQKKSSALSVIETLRRAGALTYTIVVMSSPDDPPALRYLAPYAGCTMGEALMDEGHDVLVIYDDLSKHADAYRELSLLLRRPPGREAYPGDVFYLHSRLLERAGKLNDEAGGASLTALPIAQTQQGNIATYIPTNLISITDGQIILDTDLFNRGIKPAVNIGLSVSRVGGEAQTAAMQAVAGHLRLDLAQFEEVAHFARFGTEVDISTQRQIQRGKRLQAVLTQPPHQPLSQAAQVVALLAAVEGYLDDIPVEKVPAFERGLLNRFEKEHRELLQQINHSGQLSEEMREALLKTMDRHRAAWHEEKEAV